jgi:hypothetical protein
LLLLSLFILKMTDDSYYCCPPEVDGNSYSLMVAAAPLMMTATSEAPLS